MYELEKQLKEAKSERDSARRQLADQVQQQKDVEARLRAAEKTSTISIKGAEIAAQGFIDFTRIVKSRIELLIVDNSSSTDSVQIKKMFEENKVNHLVRWISPQEDIGRVSSEEMASIYRISDVILGDFGSNWFGQTALESAVHAKPFISKMDSDFMLENFQDNPFCLAADASEISLKLLELYENENARSYYGAKMHSWFNKNFDEDSVSDWYRTQIERVLNYK